MEIGGLFALTSGGMGENKVGQLHQCGVASRMFIKVMELGMVCSMFMGVHAGG